MGSSFRLPGSGMTRHGSIRRRRRSAAEIHTFSDPTERLGFPSHIRLCTPTCGCGLTNGPNGRNSFQNVRKIHGRSSCAPKVVHGALQVDASLMSSAGRVGRGPAHSDLTHRGKCQFSDAGAETTGWQSKTDFAPENSPQPPRRREATTNKRRALSENMQEGRFNGRDMRP